MNVMATQKRLRHDSDLSKLPENNDHGVIATSGVSLNVRFGRADEGGRGEFAVRRSGGTGQFVELPHFSGEQWKCDFGWFKFGVPHLLPLVTVPPLVAALLQQLKAFNHREFATSEKYIICVPVAAHQIVGLLGRVVLVCVIFSRFAADGVFPVGVADAARITSESRRQRFAIESPWMMCVPEDSHCRRVDLI